MNQYEIELRDKFALKAIDKYIEDNMLGHFEECASPAQLGKMAYEWAGAVMAERQKHLDAIGMANAQAAGYKVQGTKCER